MSEEKILLQQTDGHAALTLNRPELHNPLDGALIDGLAGHLQTLARDGSVRVLTLRGAGPSFCAGADLKYVLANLADATKTAQYTRRVRDAFQALQDFPHPTIAVVHGFVLAGGLEMMMACDLCLAADDALLGDQHANFGLFPGGGATQRLPRLIGMRKAKELMLLGSRITGTQAEALGLVNLAVPAERLQAVSQDWVANLAEKSPTGLRLMKEAVGRGADIPLENGLDLEEKIFADYSGHEDMAEGLRAFQEKRKPQF